VADRQHFFSLAARVMRQVLIDDARRQLAGRRGGGVHIENVGDVRDLAAPARPAELLALDEGLDLLAVQDPFLAELVELRFFAGLPFERIAETTQRSERTLRRDWRRARAFLYDWMREQA
jgi:RNA polymerase sigma factor (TIGR02999 family)